MPQARRVFILGAGFSKSAGMPLATELLPLLAHKIDVQEMQNWLEDLSRRLDWLSGGGSGIASGQANIEQVFHNAYFDIEYFRLRQHLSPVRRQDGPGTPWSHAESIHSWLSFLEDALCDVILEEDSKADLSSIVRWAESIGENDSVLTFNYDTLVERALTSLGRSWNHGIGLNDVKGISVHKYHGSIDWIISHRSQSPTKLDLLYDKPNLNRSDGDTQNVEDDFRLWRCTSRSQLLKWISGRELQSV
ncbi:MAG: hypothetical protein WC655_24140, partial [Candidatus Hydrogenedentales bacterium]